MSVGVSRLTDMTSPPGPDAETLAAAGLVLEVTGPVATITLQRPEVRNAQTPLMWRVLAEIGAGLSEEVRVVVLRGSGAGFSAGLDRRLLDPAAAGDGDSVAALLQQSAQTISAAVEVFQQGFTWLRNPRFVSIAAVHGHAIGAGFQLALSCDLRLAASDATFCMKEAALGLVPDLTGTQPLVEQVGYARALEICATARTLDAQEALSLGLVLDVVEPDALESRLDALVASLTAPLPGVTREAKAILQGATRRSLDDQRLIERAAQVRRFHELAALAAPQSDR